MKKIIFFLLLLLISCSTPKQSERLRAEMDQYLGYDKSTLIQNIGFPTRTETLDGKNVLIYTELRNGLGRQYYQHKIFFLNIQDKVVTWLFQTNEIPVERLDIRLISPPRVY